MKPPYDSRTMCYNMSRSGGGKRNTSPHQHITKRIGRHGLYSQPSEAQDTGLHDGGRTAPAQTRRYLLKVHNPGLYAERGIPSIALYRLLDWAPTDRYHINKPAEFEISQSDPVVRWEKRPL